MTEDQIRQIIREELSSLIKSDRFTFEKTLQLLDGRNIQTGRGTGTRIGTAPDQKIALYGETPIVQQGAISAPTAPGATYAQSEAASTKTAIDAIRTALTNFGITA